MYTNKKMIFFNIGWMKNYKGFRNDQIVGGGSFVKKKGYGHEIFNFQKEKGYMYGYVQPVIPHKIIKIEKLGASAKDKFIENVLSVWVSNSPSGGSFIIGWYNNAIIYRNLQNPSPETIRKHGNEKFGFYVKAKVSDCTLLPVDRRTFSIPRGKGGMGQSNVWYADAKDNIGLKEEVLKFIKTGKQKPATGKQTKKSSRTRQTDPYKRQKIEKAAIRETIRYYEKLGYFIFSVERDNVGWDLEAIFKNKELLIEVKGLSQNEVSVELTPNEYEKMGKHQNNYRLCILTNALSPRKILSIFSYSPENEQWEDDNGRVLDISEIKSARMRLKK
jgi:hypothetical protein